MAFSSSLKDEVWHCQTGRNAFESWHFDALSDDGREALVITFHDNYPFSPRYFDDESIENGSLEGTGGRFPAISFTYSVDGKVVLHTVNEYISNDFSAARAGVNCSIADSSFRVDAAEYGSGYILKIDLLTKRKRRIKAELEWLSVEADLLEATAGDSLSAASWNMVAPRSDVSGRITLVGRRGKTRKLIHFRGTGYHDHFRSASSLEETTGARCWGRAHFVDSTAIFQHLAGDANGQNSSNLFLIRDGKIHERETQSELQNPTRSLYGLKILRRLSFVSDDNMRLRVKPVKVIQSGFFEAKMLSEITLMLRDGRPRKTFGITEFTAPGRLKNSLYRWLSDLRIGRNGKSPLF